MLKKTLLTALAALALAASSHAITYSANDLFASSELNNTLSSTFGPFSVGYASAGDPSTFSAFGSGDHGSFFGNGNVTGFYVHNNALVPAAVVNTSNGAVGPVGPVPGPLASHQILLHPGGTSGNAFTPPIYDAILRFTATAAGNYSYSALFSALDSGTTIDGVLHNNAVIANSGSLFLGAGDHLDFFVNAAGDISNDSTGLFASVSTVPDGGNAALLLGGSLLALVAAERLRRILA